MKGAGAALEPAPAKTPVPEAWMMRNVGATGPEKARARQRTTTPSIGETT
jgi:hypothetical protein